MSLQYRTRSLSEDRNWWQRIRLCNTLLLETTDWWCRSGDEFPVSETVDAIVYLFSPRCDPDNEPESGLRERLAKTAESVEVEYVRAWPNRNPDQATELRVSITEVLNCAEAEWLAGSLLEPTIETVTQQIASEIARLQFVVFHHRHTTRRDFGGFHGHG